MANTFLTKTFASDSNRKTWTWSAWIKRSKLGGTQTLMTQVDGWNGNGNAGFYIIGDQLTSYNFTSSLNSGTSSYNRPSMFLRDVNGWYHIVVRLDTTQSTASNRCRWYVNGEQLTDFAYANYPSLNQDCNFNGGDPHGIGSHTAGANYFDGVMSYINFSDGYSYAPTVFGSTDSTTGEWTINTNPTFTLGTHGFTILKNGNTITDQSTNSNNWGLGGGTLTKTEDCPSNVFATWNPLQATTAATYDFSAGNTRMAVNDTAVFSLGATLAATTGKYYMEMKWVQQGGNGSWGMIPIDTNINNRPRDAGVGWNQGDNAPHLLGSIVSGSWGGSIGTNDIIQLAMDLDNGAFYFGKNGTYLNSGNPTSGSSKTGAVNFSGTSLFGKQLTFAIGKGASGTDGWNANFGNGYFEQTAVSSAGTNASNNGIFEYDVPTGYTALSTKGLNL